MSDWKELIRLRLAPLNLSPTREAEIAEELAQHAEDRYRELQSGGIGEADAHRMALDEVTAPDLLESELQAVEQTQLLEPVVPGGGIHSHFLSGLMQDLQYGLRTLRRSPGFTAVAVLALSLGIGANTAIFSVVNGILLQPLSFQDSDRLVKVYESTPDFSTSSVPYPNYLDWRRLNRSFTDMGSYRNDDFNFTGAGTPQQLPAEYISASLFPMLGVKPILGRNFLPEEDRQGAPCPVMISYNFWQSQFAGNPNIIGKTLTLNALSCSVVGVLPRQFRFREGALVFVPIEQSNSLELRTRESSPGLEVLGRLRTGISLQSAQKEMAAICSGLARQYPATNASHTAKLFGMKDDLVQNIRPTLILLLGAVGFVLIIACANVANLLLARSIGRKREFAIRTALGAERWRVVRQLLVESALLSSAGALIGILLAHWGTRLVMANVPGSLPRSGEIAINSYVLLFTFLISFVTGILFGVAPAFYSARANPQDSLKEGTRGAGGARHRLEGVFVAVEVGLAVILLVGAGLMLQSVWRILQVNPGFNTTNVLNMEVALSPKVMTNPKGHTARLPSDVRPPRFYPGCSISRDHIYGASCRGR